MLKVLPINFQLMKWLGLWYGEDENPSLIKKIQHHLVLASIAYFEFCTVMKLFISLNNVDNMASSAYLAVDWTAFCFAMTNFVLKRDRIIKLRSKYREAASFQLDNEDEMRIHRKTIALNTKIFRIMATIYITTILDQLIAPLFWPKIALPYDLYAFYSIEDDSVVFWITYFFQTLTMGAAVFISLAHDSMIYGFIILAGGQFESLAYRIRTDIKYSKKSDLVKTWSIRYKTARELVECLEDVFLPIIVTTIALALLTLCTIIYVLSQTSILSMAFLEVFFYLVTIMCQTLMFCWFGNELMDKSEEVSKAVEDIDWAKSSPKIKRDVQLFSVITQESCKISFHGQLELTLETYVWVLKTSYSAFSLLKSTAENQQ